MIAANILMVVAMGCPTTTVKNRTDEWNSQDKQAKEVAENSCISNYANSPCLKFFEKVEQGLYNATCGAKDGK